MIDPKLKEIPLKESGFKAFLATKLTFGEVNKINNVMVSEAKGEISSAGTVTPTFDGNALIHYNEIRLLTIIKQIINDKGEPVDVTMANLNELPCEDGELLDKESNAVLEEIKKKANRKATT